MTLDEALARADRLCPPKHPSGKRVLYTVDTRKRLPIADRNQQLDSADALGVLAAKVRELQDELRACGGGGALGSSLEPERP
jgi:hypothetical protein